MVPPPSPLPTRIYVSVCDGMRWLWLSTFSIPLRNFQIFGFSKKCPKIFLRLRHNYSVGENVFSLDGTSYRCPKCDGEVRWTCPGDTGYAHCEHAPEATRIIQIHLIHELKFCDWKGKCRRRENGSVEIYYHP